MNRISISTIAFACFLPLSTTAFAGDLCDGLEGKKLEKCEKKRTKQVAKQRSATTTYLPSSLGAGFDGFDGEEANPFNQDKYYLGEYDVGIDQINDVLNEVVKVQAAIKMAKYVGDLHQSGDEAGAAKLAPATIKALVGLKDAQADIQSKVDALLGADPKTLVDDPSDALKAVKGIGKLGVVAGSLPATFADLPAALSAVEPLIKGAVSGAVDAAKAAAGDAINEATGGAMDKAAEAVEGVQDAAEDAKAKVDDAKEVVEDVKEAAGQ